MTKKNKLFEKCLDDKLDEAWGGGGSVFGGAGGGGSGTFSYSQMAGAKTWSPGSPPFRGITGSPGGLNTKDLGEESETFAKQAGKNRPFPLDTIHDHLVEAYLNLKNAEEQLNTTVNQNVVFDDENDKQAALKSAKKKIESLSKMIFEVSTLIDRVTLS